MRPLEKHIQTIVVAFCIFALAVTAAVAQGGGSRPGDGVERVAEVEPEAVDAMSTLAVAADAGDAMAPEIAGPIGANAEFGVNPDLSRLAIGQASGSVFLLPGDGYVCAALEVGDGASLNCARTADIAAGEAGPATVTLDNGAIGIYGMVPDGVGEVTVRTGVSDSERIAVDGNAYLTAVERGTPLRSVAYTGPSGTVEFDVKDPAEAFAR